MAINKNSIGLTEVGLLLLAVFCLFSDDTLSWQFKGAVTDVHYDYQGFPTITVNSKTYFLNRVIWDNGYKIAAGDTIIKSRGDLRIKLIRANSNDTVFFDKQAPITEWVFRGPVQNIWHSSNGYYFLIVNGKQYDIDPSVWHLTKIINKGDIIYKKAGQAYINVFKPDTRETFRVKLNHIFSFFQF